LSSQHLSLYSSTSHIKPQAAGDALRLGKNKPLEPPREQRMVAMLDP
jgi:hypothetical protein